MKKIVFFLLVLNAGLGISNAQPTRDKDEKAVAVCVELLRKAMINADSIWLDKLTDAHLSYGHSGGQLQDKAAFIHSLISGQSDFVTIDLSGQTIQLWGNTAIVRHTLAAVTKDNGKPGSVKLDVLLVWQKEQKEWKLIARQAVKPI